MDLLKSLEWFSDHINFITLIISLFILLYTKRVYNVHQHRYEREITPYIKCRTFKENVVERDPDTNEVYHIKVPFYKKIHISGFNAPSKVLKISAKIYDKNTNDFITSILKNGKDSCELSLVVHAEEKEAYYFDHNILPDDLILKVNNQEIDMRNIYLLIAIDFSGFKEDIEFCYKAKFDFKEKDETHNRNYWHIIEENYYER